MTDIRNIEIRKIDELLQRHKANKLMKALTLTVTFIMIMGIAAALNLTNEVPFSAIDFNYQQNLIIAVGVPAVIMEFIIYKKYASKMLTNEELEKVIYIKHAIQSKSTDIVSNQTNTEISIEGRIVRNNVMLRHDLNDCVDNEGVYLKYNGVDGIEVKYYVANTEEIDEMLRAPQDLIELVYIAIKDNQLTYASISHAKNIKFQ